MTDQPTTADPVNPDDPWRTLLATAQTAAHAGDTEALEDTMRRAYNRGLANGAARTIQIADQAHSERDAARAQLDDALALLREARGQTEAWRTRALATERQAVTPTPSQGQDPTPEQLDAFVAGFLNTSTRVTERYPNIQAVIRDTARSAYRVGYAAALGYEITIGDFGDRVLVGDRPEPEPVDEPAEDPDDVLTTARTAYAQATNDDERTEAVAGLIDRWYAAWPDEALTDPTWPLAAELVRLLHQPDRADHTDPETSATHRIEALHAAARLMATVDISFRDQEQTTIGMADRMADWIATGHYHWTATEPEPDPDPQRTCPRCGRTSHGMACQPWTTTAEATP